ncbi:hypothetical protein LDG_7793 [Legionella drancourtii LLAP12]|uniref:Esterase n=2 Tax=Legionella drancourtii TaxID=168933 RepID=G9ER81_9GAMM|nr:hypothetical protein LDG_7793 [Legionella drancourtii LLAP12]
MEYNYLTIIVCEYHMPKAEKYIYRPTHDGVGSLVLAKKAEPKTMEGDRILYIHKPQHTNTKPGVLILMDGMQEKNPGEGLKSTPDILDELYKKNLIPPQVSVFIPAPETWEERAKEYACNDDFTRFINNQLIPLLQKSIDEGGLECSTDRELTTIGGTSFGGLAATHAALMHPETFGNVLAQSPAFWWYKGWEDKCSFDPKYGREAGAGNMEWLGNPKYPKYSKENSIKFYIEGGEAEGSPNEFFPVAKELNKLFQKRLSENYGHTVENPSIEGGDHSYRFWQDYKALALQTLLPKPTPQRVVDQEKKTEESTTQQFRDTLQQMKDLETTSNVTDEMENTSSSTPLKTTPKPPWEK